VSNIHKGRLQLRRFVQCRYFVDKGGSSEADDRTFGAKNPNFLKFIVCPHGRTNIFRETHALIYFEKIHFVVFIFPFQPWGNQVVLL